MKDFDPRCILSIRMATRMADLDELIRQLPRSKPARLEPRICEALMLAHYDFVYRLALSYLGDASDADDAAQETFIQAAQHIDQYQAGTNLKSWLARITLNVCHGRFRHQKAIRRLEQVLQRATFHGSASTPTPEDACLQNEQRQAILRAVEALDEKHRLPVLLRYVHGLSAPEIAQALGEAEGTIYSRLHYANRKLRDQLGGLIEVESEKKAGLK